MCFDRTVDWFRRRFLPPNEATERVSTMIFAHEWLVDDDDIEDDSNATRSTDVLASLPATTEVSTTASTIEPESSNMLSLEGEGFTGSRSTALQAWGRRRAVASRLNWNAEERTRSVFDYAYEIKTGKDDECTSFIVVIVIRYSRGRNDAHNRNIYDTHLAFHRSPQIMSGKPANEWRELLITLNGPDTTTTKTK